MKIVASLFRKKKTSDSTFSYTNVIILFNKSKKLIKIKHNKYSLIKYPTYFISVWKYFVALWAGTFPALPRANKRGHRADIVTVRSETRLYTRAPSDWRPATGNWRHRTRREYRLRVIVQKPPSPNITPPAVKNILARATPAPAPWFNSERGHWFT